MARLDVPGLPDMPLEAAAEFHQMVMPVIRAALITAPPLLTLVFTPEDHAHRGWRLATVQELAREFAPTTRVNAVEGDDEAAIAAAVAYLDTAEGVTGQVLMLDSNGVGQLLYEDG